MNRLAVLLVLALATAGSSVDTLPVSGPAGSYTVVTSGPTRITSGPTWVRLDWGEGKDGGRKDEGGKNQSDPPTSDLRPPSSHTGHFTVSYIEPKYPTPASAAVRDQLAGENWAAIDAGYRSYTEGQTQVTTLGFTGHYKPADLPIAFLQEDGPSGSPIIGTMKAPASGDAVIIWVKGFRGQ